MSRSRTPGPGCAWHYGTRARGWDVTLVGLDVTDDTLFRAADLARVEASSSAAARIVASVTPFYMRFYEPIVELTG